MGKMVKLAFRNIFRFKRRTLITLSAVSIGLAMLIISLSLLDGIDQQSMNNVVNSQTAALTVFAPGYFDKKDEFPLGLNIPNPQPLRDQLATIPGVQATECRIRFAASLIRGSDEMPCLGIAMEPDRDPALFNLRQSLREGNWLGTDEARILVGRDLARNAQLKTGDQVSLRLITSDREENLSWNAIDVEIGGIIETGNPLIDSMSVVMPLKLAQDGLVLGDAATEIAIRLRTPADDEKSLDRAAASISAVLRTQTHPLQVYFWKQLETTFLAISQAKSKGAAMIVFIMLFIASMGIVNTMLMAVFERTREIGMLAAMGMRPGEILRLFVLEGGFIGLFGSLLGCLLGALGGWYLETHGISIAAMGGETISRVTAAFYPVKDVFYANLTGQVVFKTFILGTLISLLASLYPALKATRLSPIDALRHI